jgi:hypothetical protein
MAQRAIRFSETTDKEIQTATRKRGFLSLIAPRFTGRNTGPVEIPAAAVHASIATLTPRPGIMADTEERRSIESGSEFDVTKWRRLLSPVL